MKKYNVAFLGMFTALALVISYLEMLIPFSFGIPGVKLGLANLVIVLVLYLEGARAGLFVSVIRIILSGMLFGNLFGILYSLSGGLLSFIIMLLAKRCGKFSIMGVSMFGGIFHNIGQLIIALFVVSNLSLLYYIPVLLVSGVLTGAGIGWISKELYPRLCGMKSEKNRS